jgi:hypothetical protein
MDDTRIERVLVKRKDMKLERNGTDMKEDSPHG